VSFDLLSGEIDGVLDLIEFVETGIEGKRQMKSASGGIAGGGGNDFTLEVEGSGRERWHEKILNRGLNVREG
jgi:hypothetical protein